MPTLLLKQVNQTKECLKRSLQYFKPGPKMHVFNSWKVGLDDDKYDQLPDELAMLQCAPNGPLYKDHNACLPNCKDGRYGHCEFEDQFVHVDYWE